MAETTTLALTSPADGSEIAPMDLEAFQSRLKDIQGSGLESEASVSDSNKKLVEEAISDFQGRFEQIDLEVSSIPNIGPQDLDAFLEQLRNGIGSTEEETMRISNEIDDVMKTFARDSSLLAGDLESLALSLNLNGSQGLNVGSSSGDAHESLMDVSEDNKLKILKHQHQTERHKNILSIMQDLGSVLKRIEAIGQIEDKLYEVKVLEFEGNCIRLSLKTPIPSLDSLLLRHKLDCLVEPSFVEHELLIEVIDNTLELHKVEIFPNDVPLDDIIYAVKSSSNLGIAMGGSMLECLVRKVQYRILLCTLKQLLLKDAKKSRHSFEYSNRDETITAHLVGDIDAFIKIPQSWPISDSGLTLVSIKNSNVQSKCISLSFLYRIKELANSLHIQTRGHLVRFMDAIEEILVQEMHSEVHPSGTSA